jgi:hypothetical protein
LALKAKNSKSAIYWSAGIVLVAGLLYFKTICPTVEFIDSGELAVNCLLLGIAHPTGYPLYVLLGRLAVILLPGDIIFRCNLLSLIFTAIAASVLFRLISAFLPERRYRFSAAGSIALFMAFSPVWWSQGTSNEVYSLTLLADLLAIFLFMQYAARKKPAYLIAGFYIWGLSFCSHMSTIFLLPAIVYMVLAVDGYRKVFKARYFWAAVFFIFALNLYLFLPVRSSFKPFLNWSNPSTWQGLINHVSGWQYRVWMFGSLSTMSKGVGYFAALLYNQFGVIGLILSLTGIIAGFIKNRKLSIFLILIILADIFYSSNYEIIDIDSYYLLGFAGLAIFAGYGLLYVIEKLSVIIQSTAYGRVIRILIIAGLVALPVSQIFDNYYEQNKSYKLYAASGVDNMLASMENNGIAIVENWDFYSPWLYYRYALNVRPDVVMIDKELLRRSWYLDFLKRYHPEIMNQSNEKTDRFLELLKPFETGKRYDSQALTAAYREMIASIINTNSIDRPVYTNILRDPDVVPNKVRMPIGVLYKFQDKPEYAEFDIARLDFTAWQKLFVYIDKRTKIALSSFYKAIAARESYCRSLGRESEAAEYGKLVENLNEVLSRKAD